jgi:hypothetical protein
MLEINNRNATDVLVRLDYPGETCSTSRYASKNSLSQSEPRCGGAPASDPLPFYHTTLHRSAAA